jgi:hypothetical protein
MSLGFGGDDCAVKDGIKRWCGVEEGGRWSVVPWRPVVTTYVYSDAISDAMECSPM